MTEQATREFDEWMRSLPTPRDPPRSDVDRILDAYAEYWEANAHDPAWVENQEDMYYESLMGQPSNMEEFDEETRDIDQWAYEEWAKP